MSYKPSDPGFVVGKPRFPTIFTNNIRTWVLFTAWLNRNSFIIACIRAAINEIYVQEFLMLF